MHRGMCEDSGLKRAVLGVPGDTMKRRWYGPCGRQHEGTRYSQRRGRIYLYYRRVHPTPRRDFHSYSEIWWYSHKI
eukprot:SAG25_NODE_3244_length_1160_cov_2.246937_3_plen_75_part_01